MNERLWHSWLRIHDEGSPDGQAIAIIRTQRGYAKATAPPPGSRTLSIFPDQVHIGDRFAEEAGAAVRTWTRTPRAAPGDPFLDSQRSLAYLPFGGLAKVA